MLLKSENGWGSTGRISERRRQSVQSVRIAGKELCLLRVRTFTMKSVNQLPVLVPAPLVLSMCISGLNPKNSESTAEEDPETIYMSPDGSVAKEPVDFSIELPESLERAYLSAVEAHTSANYSATALCCKQAMEKIFFQLLPEEKSSIGLSNAISEIHDNHDLARPLENLSVSTSSGGKLERHFEMESEFNAETSKAMVELLEHLITYLYVIPREIQNIEDKIDEAA